MVESLDMKRMAPVSGRQIEVLKWIADGCPDGVMQDHTYKTTAVALQGRHLVTVTRKGGIWRATVTETGRHYLQHGTSPPDPEPVRPTAATTRHEATTRPAIRHRTSPADMPTTPARPIAQTTAAQYDGLVARVSQAGGILEIDTETDKTDYERLIAAARKSPDLPYGKQLRSRRKGSWWSNAREIYLDEDFAARVTARPVPVPSRVATWHPAVAAYRADAHRHEVSRDSVRRPSQILQALAAEATRRGYTPRGTGQQGKHHNGPASSSPKDGHLQIAIGDFSYRLRLRERSGTGGVALGYGPRRDRLPRWQQTRQTEFVPTGELRVTIEEGYGRDKRPAEFRDTKRASLEERLPEVLRELEIRAAEDGWRRQQEREEAEDKRRRWEEAMETARHDFREARLAQALRGQLEHWQLSKHLDGFLSELEMSVSAMGNTQEQAAAAEWLTWARQYQQRIDPLSRPLSMPRVPRPSPEELKPFLHGWNPYQP